MPSYPRLTRAALALALTGTSLVAASAVAPQADAAANSTCGPAALVAIRTADATLQRWTDATPLTAGGVSAADQVGQGWSDARLTAADSTNGLMFAVFGDGSMRAYQWDAADGSYRDGATIGKGWQDVVQLIPQGHGVLYAVTSDGTMNLYVYDAANKRWLNGGNGVKIGHGWQAFTNLASGGNGIVYAVERSTGQLYWYKRSNFANATSGSWAPRKLVSSSSAWTQYTSLVGAGDGVLYGVHRDGTLRWYNHSGAQTGTGSWSGPTTVGSGWGSYRALTTAPSACRPPATGGVPDAPPANPYGPSHNSDGARLTPRAQFVADQVEARWKDVPCWGYDTADTRSDHSTGNGIDCTIGAIGRYPGASDKQDGDEIAAWLKKYASTLKVKYVIWYGKIWSTARSSEGWRTYTAGTGVTQGHYDHVHISVEN